MGMSYDAVLIVGLPYEDFDKEQLDELQSNTWFKRASPHYDADPEYCIFGIIVAHSYDNKGVIDLKKIDAAAEKAKAKFLKLTGLKGKLHLAADVI